LYDVIGLITLPSLLLNMLFSIPIYVFIRDLARWVYPVEEYDEFWFHASPVRFETWRLQQFTLSRLLFHRITI